MEKTINDLIQDTKDHHGAIYRRLLSLNAENQRLSLKIRDLEEIKKSLHEEVAAISNKYMQNRCLSCIEAEKLLTECQAKIKSEYERGYEAAKRNMVVEVKGLDHSSALAKSDAIAERFFPRFFWDNDEFTRIKLWIYNCLRTK